MDNPQTKTADITDLREECNVQDDSNYITNSGIKTKHLFQNHPQTKLCRTESWFGSNIWIKLQYQWGHGAQKWKISREANPKHRCEIGNNMKYYFQILDKLGPERSQGISFEGDKTNNRAISQKMQLKSGIRSQTSRRVQSARCFTDYWNPRRTLRKRKRT